MGSKAGVITGLLLGLSLVGGLAATPLFIDALRSPEDAVRAATRPDLQTVNRVVLHLDPGTALLADIYESTGDEKAFDGELVEEYADAIGDATFLSASVLQNLKRSLDALQNLNNKDRQRGTAILGKGTPDARNRHKPVNIVRDIQPYLKESKNLLQSADNAISALRGTTVDGLSGDQTLAAQRAKAMLYLVNGQLSAQRARLEYGQAALAQTAAQDLAMTLIELRSRADSLDAEDPRAAIEEIEARMAALDAGLQQAGAGIAQLANVVETLRAQLQSAQDDAGAAAEELGELDEADLGFASYESKYRELAARQRQAEAAIATLTYGTLANATEVPQSGAYPAPPTYEGGSPQPGLEALDFRLHQANEQVKQLTASREALAARRDTLQQLGASLNEKRAALSAELDTQTTRINELIVEARTFTNRAEEYESKGIAAFADAARFASSAAHAAAIRAREAASGATAGGGEPDERLQRIGSDMDMEASMHCLAAEAAFHAAIMHLGHLEAIRAVSEAESLLATVLRRGESPPTAGGDAQRVEATNLLVTAAEEFDKALKLLERSNVRVAGGTLSGKNYAWQVQVGLAAVYLARASLAGDDPEARFNEQSQAYEMLRQAIEGREQSPMLATAVDAFEYLQRTAR